MKRREFLLKAFFTGLAVQFRSAISFAQQTPFSYWKTTSAYGEIRATQMIMASVAQSASAALQSTQMIMTTVTLSGAADLQATQMIMSTVANAGGNSDLRATQMIMTVIAK